MRITKKLDVPMKVEQADLINLLKRERIPIIDVKYNYDANTGEIKEYSYNYVEENVDLAAYSTAENGIPMQTLKEMARILAKIHSIKKEDININTFQKLKEDYEGNIGSMLSFFETTLPKGVNMIRENTQAWLGSICLMDYSPKNILVDKTSGEIKCLIDLDMIIIGNPLYDLMSTLCFLNEEDRRVFLEEYLMVIGKSLGLPLFQDTYFLMYLLNKLYLGHKQHNIPKTKVLSRIHDIIRNTSIGNITKNKENCFGLMEDFLAAKLKGQIRHISITVTNFCNNHCEYCTRPLFDEKEFDVDKFERLIKWLAEGGIKKVIIFGGEPTLHSRFNELMEILKKNSVTCTLLSNGRFGTTGFFKYIGNVIKQISLHVPTLKDKNMDVWGKEATGNIVNLQKYMKEKEILIPIGLGNVVDHADWEWRILLKISNKYGIDFIGFCMAHPTDIFRKNNYAPFAVRQDMMADVFDAFRVFKRYNKRIALDFFMPCLIDDNIKKYPPKKQKEIRTIFQKSYSPQRMYELNFMTDGSVEIGTCLFKENRLVVPNALSFQSIEKLEGHIEQRFEEAALNKKWPAKCLNCRYFNKICKGDHLNLISEFESRNKANQNNI